MEPTKEQVRTRLQGAIDTGQLQGIRSDGVNTNPRTQESARSVGSNLAASVSTINSNALKPTPVVNPPALPTPPVNTRINSDTNISESSIIPEKSAEPTIKEQTQQFLQDQLGDGGRIDTQSVREELRLDEKRQKADYFDNQIISVKTRYEDQIAELEKNPEGKLRGNLNQQINKLFQEANKELAKLSFSFKIANDDLTGARETYNARVADMKDYRDYQFQVNRAIEESLENDWTESEKEIFLNNEKIKADEIYFEQQKELADYNAQLSRSNAVFENSLKTPDQTSVEDYDAALEGNLVAIEKLGYDPRELPEQQRVDNKKNQQNYDNAIKSLNVVRGAIANQRGLNTATTAVGGKAGALGRFVTGLLKPKTIDINRSEDTGELSYSTSQEGGLTSSADFMTAIKYIDANLTLNKLSNMDVVLTPLSDADMTKVGQAADELSGMIVRDDAGVPVGLVGSTKKANDLLNDINTRWERVVDELNTIQALDEDEIISIYQN